jgi:hypothetical protein
MIVVPYCVAVPVPSRLNSKLDRVAAGGDFFDTEFGACEIRDGARRLVQVRANRRLRYVLGKFVESTREFGEFGICAC